ncbi:RNA ligase [uncultured virus]|nr:RNA ligase [uncultured virus]
MNFIDTLPINQLIKNLSEKKGSVINFDELKIELQSKQENGLPKYNINVKEYEDLGIIYYNNLPENNNLDHYFENIEVTCRSYIIEKKSLKPIASQYNKILYNNDAKEYLKQVKWENVKIQKCYEGTMLLVFNYNDKWYVSTRRCLNASDSKWIKNKSYREMFDEAMTGKFVFDDLNKEYCYFFILVHYKNKNLVNYNNFGKDYKELLHILTTKKYSLEEIDYKINGLNYIDYENFENSEQLYNSLDSISQENESNQNITDEGYILKVYNGEPFKSNFCVLKIQTNLYQKLSKMKPNNSNIHQIYLELYQQGDLNEFLPYFTKYNNDIIKRIHFSMKNLSKELLDLYHSTRQKKNPNIYSNLTEIYKKILYGLHGLYIDHKKKELVDIDKETKENSRSVNIHDVYYFLKELSAADLRQLYLDRTILMDNNNCQFLNKNCVYTMTQSMLMFRNFKNK